MFGSRCRNADDIFVPRPLCRDAAARAPTRHQKKEKTGDRDGRTLTSARRFNREEERVDTRLVASYDQNNGTEAHKLKLLCEREMPTMS